MLRSHSDVQNQCIEHASEPLGRPMLESILIRIGRETFNGWSLVRLLLEVAQHLPLYTNSLSRVVLLHFKIRYLQPTVRTAPIHTQRAILTPNGPY